MHHRQTPAPIPDHRQNPTAASRLELTVDLFLHASSVSAHHWPLLRMPHPPKPAPISAPLVPTLIWIGQQGFRLLNVELTFTIPQSLPSGPSHLPILCTLLVKSDDDSPWGTALLILAPISASHHLSELRVASLT